MEIEELSLPGLLLFKPRVHGDARGFFLETWRERDYRHLTGRLVQDNQSRSGYGVLRGLHYQLANPQGKLVRVARGRVYDVAVDIRRGSPTFGRWAGVTLDDEQHHQLWVPPGFAHGFCVLSESADFCYRCSDYYAPGDEYGIAWDDPGLAIDWGVGEPIVSGRDRTWPTLADADPATLPATE